MRICRDTEARYPGGIDVNRSGYLTTCAVYTNGEVQFHLFVIVTEIIVTHSFLRNKMKERSKR